MTIQKRIILDELGKTKKHPTAETLYSIIKKRLPEISIGTVYRNLEILTQRGKAQRIIDRKRKNRFDGNIDRHFHIECSSCNRLEDLPKDSVEILNNDIDIDFEITGYNLYFCGLCPDCKSEMA